MKKKNVEGAEDRLAKRNGIHLQLCTTSAEVRKMTRILQNNHGELEKVKRALKDFEKELAEKQRALSGLRSFQGALNPTFHEERLTAEEKVNYAQLKAKISTAETTITDTQNQLDALRSQEISLQAELFEGGEELEDVLHFQENLNEAERKVTDIQDAILKQKDIIEKANLLMQSSVEPLLRKREDILADIAVGVAKESDLKELDEQIEIEIEKVYGAKGEVKTVTDLAQQTIAGLQRKLAPLQGELAALKEQRKGVLVRFLTSEAEKVGAEYARLADEITTKFRQLIALDGILSSTDSSESIADNIHDLFIPQFHIQSHVAERAALWSSNGIGVMSTMDSDSCEDDLQAEKDRISGMGIVL
jgi:chromosome segregation ATPase